MKIKHLVCVSLKQNADLESNQSKRQERISRRKCQGKGRKLIEVINNRDIKIFSMKGMLHYTTFFSILYQQLFHWQANFLPSRNPRFLNSFRKTGHFTEQCCSVINIPHSGGSYCNMSLEAKLSGCQFCSLSHFLLKFLIIN